MQGFAEALIGGILLRVLGAGLGAVLLAAPLKKVARAQLKKIYVLNEMGDMAGEYVLDPECPIDFNDFLHVLPEEGVGDRETLFVGEYVFTTFQSGKFVFVLLSRGQLAPEDIDWTALLLTAADSHLATAAKGPPAGPKPAEGKASADAEAALAEREGRVAAKEKDLTKLEAQLQADAANLKGRAEELERQKARLTALAHYGSQMQQSVSKGVARALQTLEMAEQIAAAGKTNVTQAEAAGIADARKQFEDERQALLVAKDDLEKRYRDASRRIQELEVKERQATEALERDRQDYAKREAEAEKMRVAIEARVQELSVRFAQMAKERLMNSHKPATPGGEPAPGSAPEIEAVRAELTKERKFLQRRAIELLDREERLRDVEAKLAEREAATTKREQEVAARAADLEKARAAAPVPAVAAEEARRDIERRVKIIQQKAVELLDREEKLRKRAEELEALEARLSGKVPAR